MRQTGVEGGFTHRVAMDHPLGTQLMVCTVPGLFEIKRIGLADRAIIALAVGISEVPPAPRQVVVEARIFRSFPVVTDCIVAPTQHQLIGQTQRAVPLKPRTPLLFTGTFLTVVSTRQADTPGLLRRVFDHYRTPPTSLPGASSICAWLMASG